MLTNDTETSLSKIFYLLSIFNDSKFDKTFDDSCPIEISRLQKGKKE